MYGTIAETHRPNVSVTSDTRVLQMVAIGSVQGVITQTTVTRTETWTGLSQSDAESLLVSSQSSVKDGVNRPYLGGIKIYIGDGGVYAWTTAESCWGTIVNSSYQRMADTNLFAVQRQTQTLTVKATGASEVVYL